MGEVESGEDPERCMGAIPLVTRGHAVGVEGPTGEDLSATFRRLGACPW
jgi:hypothetical protein